MRMIMEKISKALKSTLEKEAKCRCGVYSDGFSVVRICDNEQDSCTGRKPQPAKQT